MKKFCLVLLSILIFIIGINYAKAETYKFDFTGDVSDPVYQYDQDTQTCLFSYFKYMTDAYPGEYNFVEGTSSIVFSINQKELYTWDLSNHTLIKSSGVTGADNFTADLTVLDNASNYECALYSAYGFDTLEVYFESDEEIPVINYYTLDLTKKTSFDDFNELDTVLLLVMFGVLNDDITPDVDILTLSPADYPLILNKNNVGFFEFGINDTGTDEYFKLLNQDKFTVHDNFSYSVDFLNNPDNFVDDTIAHLANEILDTYFDRYNIVFSNNESIDTEEESDTVVPNNKEEKKESEPNPKSGDNIGIYTLLTIGSGLVICLINKKRLIKE